MNSETSENSETILNELTNELLINQFFYYYCSIDMLFLATKLMEKIPDPHNAKEYYQSFIRKKNTKPLKRLKVITCQQKLLKTQTLLI